MDGICRFVLTDFTSPVSQWSNDESFGAAKEFVLVFKAHVCDVDKHLVPFLIKVEATLLQPLKISATSDIESALEEEILMINISKNKEQGKTEESMRGGKEEG